MNSTPVEDNANEGDVMEEPLPIHPEEDTSGWKEGQPLSGPALTINVQTWATPVVGLVMLAIGLLAGYFGRPLVDTADTPVPQSEVNSAPTVMPGASASTGPDAQQQALMEALISQTVHFKGDPAAPVTLIEFSDFQ